MKNKIAICIAGLLLIAGGYKIDKRYANVQETPEAGITWVGSPVRTGAPVHDSNVITVGDANDYTTITAAIAASISGDVIEVSTGTYTENISITAGRIIQGNSPGGVVVTGNITIAATGSMNWIHQTDGFTLTQN